MFMIKEIPITERPRERFIKYGPTSLSNHELIAIILRTGTKRQSVLELSKDVLYKFQSIKELKEASLEDLIKIKGIGHSKAISLLTCFELQRRMNEEIFDKSIRLNSPEKIYHYMKDNLELKTQEHLVALYINTKGILIRKQTLFIGSLSSSVIHPREIFKYAVSYSAASIIICHNHPSGDPTPSINDVEVTKLIHKNSLMMDIPLMDHIIIGRDKYYSFKEHNII